MIKTRLIRPTARSELRTRFLRHAAWVLALLALAVLAATGCGTNKPVDLVAVPESQPTPAPVPPVPTVPENFVEPDFSLVDANANSATSGRAVSPRQHLGHISAWYFGHST
jgi:hypothetical protein